MNEKKNRREWVKTVAIIFLSVMLVLTFFSNTIMNYSLPEVAAQYIQSGSITTKVRGSGVIESDDPYSVKISGVRKVESVEVREGDQVQKGDILCILSYEDSTELANARALLESAQAEYDKAILNIENDVSVMLNGGTTQSQEVYRNQVIALKEEIATAQEAYDEAKKLVEDLEAWGEALSLQLSVTPSNTADVSSEQAAVDKAQAAIDAAELAILEAVNEQTRSQNEQAKIQSELEKHLETVSGGDANLVASLEQSLKEEKEKEAQAKQKQGDEEVKKAEAEYELQKAQLALNNKTASGDTANVMENLNNQISQNTIDLFHARNDMEDKEAILAEKNTALTEYVDNVYTSMNLGELLKQVTQAQETVEKLEAEMEGSEVTAPISGTIISVNVKSGLDTPDDGIVFTIQPQGEGYTLSFSVTNEQAKKLSVGDVAEPVNSWRYGDMSIVLKSIQADKTNPSQNKLLVFSVSGDSVTANQSLSVSVGQKSATYDMVVPNSAIREDNNGNFVLIVESKSSPIGTRYTASRVDVQVVASDDTQSAITGALYGYEFVITTSTKPIEAGQQVRLAD